jgi:hypothetical protein
MGSRLVKHLRGNAIAYVALFFALTAGAYAATKAPKNSVVTKSIKNNAVKTSKLADGAVTEAKTLKFAFQPVGALTNGWTTVGTSPVPTFGKDTQGFVHLRGRIRAGTQNAAAFTLPSGFRPAETESFGTGTIFGGNSTPCIVTVDTGGNVIPGVTGADSGCQPAGSTLLYGIIFRADGS